MALPALRAGEFCQHGHHLSSGHYKFGQIQICQSGVLDSGNLWVTGRLWTMSFKTDDLRLYRQQASETELV